MEALKLWPVSRAHLERDGHFAKSCRFWQGFSGCHSVFVVSASSHTIGYPFWYSHRRRPDRSATSTTPPTIAEPRIPAITRRQAGFHRMPSLDVRSEEARRSEPYVDEPIQASLEDDCACRFRHPLRSSPCGHQHSGQVRKREHSEGSTLHIFQSYRRIRLRQRKLARISPRPCHRWLPARTAHRSYDRFQPNMAFYICACRRWQHSWNNPSQERLR